MREAGKKLEQDQQEEQGSCWAGIQALYWGAGLFPAMRIINWRRTPKAAIWGSLSIAG